MSIVRTASDGLAGHPARVACPIRQGVDFGAFDNTMAISHRPAEMTDLTQQDKDEVLRQTERLVSSSQFRNSRRYTDLLRYIVRKTLAGQADTLKERTLGIEVFQREPSFDTSGDSIVRVAAAEVRKRIAQYYQEEDHEQELRIDVPTGAYAAHFRWPQPHLPVADPTLELAAAEAETPARTQRKGASRPLHLALIAGLAFLAITAASGGRYFWRHAQAPDLLEPIWQSPHDVVICIGSPLLATNQPGINSPAEAAALGQPTANNTVIPFADAMTLSRMQFLLSEHHKSNRVQLARSTSLDDLRAGPAILISGFDNPWTLRLTSQMRFHLVGSDGTQGYIADSKSKSTSNWIVDFHVPYSNRTQDYAIVAVTHDEVLGQPLVVIAGVGPNGNMAASEFLMDKANLAAVWRMAPRGWTGRNVELVLATQVIQGNSGPPRVVASEYW